jgi:hypothetical protein
VAASAINKPAPAAIFKPPIISSSGVIILPPPIPKSGEHTTAIIGCGVL